MAAPRKPQDRQVSKAADFNLDTVPDAKPFTFTLKGKQRELPGEPNAAILDLVISAEQDGLSEEELGSKMLVSFLNDFCPEDLQADLRQLGKEKLTALLNAWGKAVGLGESEPS